MPLVAAPRTFAGGLPGSHALPPIVQPLGHEVSSLATPGLVVARTRPIEIAGASIPAPVQRRASRASRQAPAEAATPAFAPAAEVIEHVPDVEHEAPAIAASPSAAIRTMPTVSRSSVRVPDRPLTSAATAARPAAVQRAAAAAPAEGPGLPLPIAPRTASGGMRRVPSGHPAATPTVSRQATSAATPAGPSPVASSSPSRSGLGEPMTSLPASARPVTSPGPVISRSTTSGPMPIAAAALRAAVQRSASDGASASPLQLGAGSLPTYAASTGTAHLPELPRLPVARPGGVSSSSGTADARPAIQRSTAEAGPQIRPIAGANPIHTSIPLQRAADEDVDDEPGGTSIAGPWWDPGETPIGSLSPLAVSDGPGPSLQRVRADAGAAPSPTGVAATTYVPAQARPAPSGRSVVQRAAAASGRSSQSIPALPAAMGPGSRVGSGGAETARAQSWSSSLAAESAPSVQTSLVRSPAPLAASFGSLGPNPVIQREGGNVAMQPETPPAAPGAPAGPGGSGPVPPTGSAGSSGHSEKDLDELAQALFGRIRGRLRSDLIYDREAKGLTFDNV